MVLAVAQVAVATQVVAADTSTQDADAILVVATDAILVAGNGCNSGCGGYAAPVNTGCSGAPTEAQPVMDNAPQAVDPVPVAPSQPSASDGAGRNPTVDPSAFIFRGQRKFGVN